MVPTAAPTDGTTVSVPGDVSSSANCGTFDNTIQTPVPSSINNWYNQEGKGNFSCDTYDGVGWYMNIWTDLMSKRQACGSTGSSDPNATGAQAPQQLLQQDTIPAHVKWKSDDPSIDGKDAANDAAVRFDLPWSPSNGPSDVATDATGLASSYTVDGLPFTVTAYTQIGPVSGDPVNATAAANMAAIELTVPLMSPKVTFHITPATAAVTLPASVTVHFNLDGGADMTQVCQVLADNSADEGTVSVIVPDNNTHNLQLTSIDTGSADTGIATPIPAATVVQRNGTYTVAAQIANIAAH
jgi:hypothetical protein